MRIVLNIISVLLILVGAVWLLQGLSVLPGSFMTGQTTWVVYGLLSMTLGSLLLLRQLARERKK